MATEFYTRPGDAERFIFKSRLNDIWTSVCNSTKKCTAFEIDDRYRLYGNKICPLMRIPTSYFQSDVASGIALDYEYKRSFDIGKV